MNTPESRVLLGLEPIEKELYEALSKAAGEPVGYVLLIVPEMRKGDHIMTSNIAEKEVILTFMRDAVDVLKVDWEKTQQYANDMLKKALN